MSRVDTAPRFPAGGPKNAPGAGGASRSLAALDGQQAGLLALLKGADSEHAELLTSLMVSNTLMELSKLASGRLSLGEFAAATLATLAQCTPVDGCAFVFSSPGLPPVRCTLGDWPDEEDHEAELSARAGSPRTLHVCPVFTNDDTSPIGYLGVSGVPSSLLDAGLLERAGSYLTSTLTLLIDAEYLRRAASAAQAMELVGSLDENYDETDLFEIVSVIQALPGAVGASLALEVPRFGGPLLSEAGLFPKNAEPTAREEVLERSGTATLRVWWGDGVPPTDSRLGEISDRLFSFLKRAEQTARLRAEVETDELTGIGNRRRASKALAQASARARRLGEEYAILMMDLDRFKSVNDKLGHDVGDQVLVSFSRAIEQVIRGYDVASRWGGEEFLVVCPSTNQIGAEALARRLLGDTPLLCAQVLPADWFQTVSIGIAVCQNPTLDSIELVRIADAAMYEAKTSGRNRFVVGAPKTRSARI